MAEAAISTLVELLGNLLVEKLKFLGNVVGEVQRLKDKLEWMQCFLVDAEEKQATDRRVKKWISDIREVAFDAEDVIQIFILNVDNPKKTGGLLPGWASFPRHVSHLDRVGREIQGIWKRLDDIEKNCAVFGIKDLGPRVDWTQQPNHIEWRRRLNPTLHDKDVVGLQKDVQSLLGRAILDDKSSLSAATVVGMGGIGKSTLARIVYNHDDVVKRFELRAWVVVSNEFEPRQIFKDLILELFDPQKDGSEMLEEMSKQKDERSKLLETIQHEDASKLQRRLYDRLKGKRYLVVLDDVWEDKHWTCFDNAFPNDDKSSRLLITSRNQISIKSTQYTHRMSILNSEESWNLFQNKALTTDNTDDKCPKDLEKLGREMVAKCGGLPLAINVVGGLLLKEGRSKSGWKKVSQQINSHSGRDDEIVSGILKLSFQTLPPRLKPCFLCLSFFKEDATIRVVKLKNLWISLGYIRREGEERVDAIATRYLDELVSRNLIQVKDTSSDGCQIKNCSVHDLIREVSITKAKEEMDLEMLDGKWNSSQPSNKPRHRVLYTPLINGESSRNKHLRSLFVYTDIDMTPPLSFWKGFELLKILDLEDCEWLMELPEAIGALIGLTYLGLKNTRVSELPRSIGKLKNLEVIEMSQKPGVAVLPRSALKLINLRHIDGENMHLELPKKIRPLKNIRRLKDMFVGPEFEQEVAQITAMPNLSYLSLRTGYRLESADLMKLFNSLENLLRLTLYFWNGFPGMEGLSTLRHVTQLKLQGGMTSRLPIEFPPNVAHLTLEDNRFKEDPMPVLEKLPCLLYLHLHDRFYKDDDCQGMVISSDGFSKLEILRFTSMPHLSRIQVGEGAMPGLKRVEIRDCLKQDAESLKEQLRPSVVVSTHQYG